MLEVDESGRNQASEQNAVDEGEYCGLMTEREPATQEDNSGQQFNQEVTNRDGGTTIAALTAEIKPGSEWHVQKPGNRVFAMRAVGRRGDDALTQWEAVDANVQKTSHHR